MRRIEGEHLTTKAVLGQKIEILEAQIAGFQEREENMNRINKSIMEALEDLNNKEGKNEFTVALIHKKRICNALDKSCRGITKSKSTI